jgi:hypothetical protein
MNFNEFEQIRFCDYRLLVDEDESDGDELQESFDESEETKHLLQDDIYMSNHPWDQRANQRFRFSPTLWRWWPHELSELTLT